MQHCKMKSRLGSFGWLSGLVAISIILYYSIGLPDGLIKMFHFLSAPVDILDFGHSFYFPASSSVNHLFIEIESRTKLSTGEEYILLAPHPREMTFRNDGRIYQDMIVASNGASEITFMLSTSGHESIIERRYDDPNQPASVLHTCAPSPYGQELLYQPKQVSLLFELISSADILHAARNGKKILALAEYEVDGVQVKIDFPVKVLNVNPEATVPDSSVPVGSQWQAASARLAILLPGGGDLCSRIHSGYLAFSDFNTELQFVYLCESSDPRLTQDFSCVQNFRGSVRLFRAGY